MSDQQLLSADPAAGLLSTDPRAGTVTPPPPPQGYWEDRGGFIGKIWHPPGVAPGQDATARRVDTNIIGGTQGGGVAPEDVLAGGMAGRAIVGAARSSGAGAAVTEAIAQASPYVKFTVAKHTLEAAGVPSILAEPAAYFISGYRRGAQAAEVPGPVDPAAPHLDRSVPVPPSALTPQQLRERIFSGQGIPPPAVEKPPLGARAAATAPAAPPIDAAPPASPPDVPAPPAAAAAPAPAPTSPAASTWSPQRIRNEVGLAARRGKLTLSDAQLDQADALVRAGQSPASAVRSVAPAPKLTVTAAEMSAYTALRRAGKTQQEAVAVLQAQRDLAARLGTPTSEAVRQAVEERNLTGRWPGEE
jgi:hypothetical protein